jgi:hypothetical protein
MSRTVKALKNKTKPSTSIDQQAQEQYRVARDQLGATFGSKKTVQAIRAAERNQVDVSALHGVASHVQNDIDTATSTLPSQGKCKAINTHQRVRQSILICCNNRRHAEDMKASMANARPIPPINESAKKPYEVRSAQR